MTFDAPLVTIGMPCYNAAETIGRALDSAAAQNWPRLEILVVDDGSGDGSVALVAARAAGDRRIRLVTHAQNRGASGARNTILAEASGDLIAFFDDDDESLPERIPAQVERLLRAEEESGKAVFCYTARMAGGRTVQAIGAGGPPPAGAEVADCLFWRVADPAKSWGPVGAGTLMARRQVLRDLGGFDEALRRSEDTDLAIRFALQGGIFVSVVRPLMLQTMTETADKGGTIPLIQALALCRKHRAYLRSRRGYLAARALIHAQFHGSRGRYGRGRLWMLAACLAAPHLVLRAKLIEKIARMQGTSIAPK